MRRRALALILIGLLAGAGLYALTQAEGSDDRDDTTTSAPTTETNGDGGSPTTAAPGPAATPATTPGGGAGNGDAVGDGVGDPANVVRVHDGDSFIARIEGGGEADVRLIGINAPDFGECLYQDGRKRLGELLRAGPLRLQRDVSDKDRHGRLLRYASVGGAIVNVAMADEGLALAVSTGDDDAHRAEIHDAQRQARAEHRGIWRVDACGPPASTAVTIAEVEPDPKGQDRFNLNGEYAVIRNSGATPVDMTGWKLRDDSTQNRFWFPKGFSLGAGAAVKVHVGTGHDSATELYWGRRYPVFDNFGDTALLLDPKANIVSYRDM